MPLDGFVASNNLLTRDPEPAVTWRQGPRQESGQSGPCQPKRHQSLPAGISRSEFKSPLRREPLRSEEEPFKESMLTEVDDEKSSGRYVSSDINHHAGGSGLTGQVEESLGHLLVEVGLSARIANLSGNILHN